jgi:hypothetical protein
LGNVAGLEGGCSGVLEGAERMFGFDVSWARGKSVVVEAATDLAAPVWSPLQTLTLTGDSIPFSDPQSTSQTVRFYRVGTLGSEFTGHLPAPSRRQ